MDNSKTGALIKELRKEKGLIQSQLAERLHITDRAVSKWERGLCAPDIALLEPLSAILGVSVVELLEGNRRISDDLVEELDVNAKNILVFSKEEIKRKTKTVRLKFLLTAAICLAVVLLIGGLILQRGGYLFVIDKSRAPDGTIDVTVYGKDFADYGGFSNQDGVALIVDRPDHGPLRVSYGDCTYQGLWWAPDSRKYVISLQYGGQRQSGTGMAG